MDNNQILQELNAIFTDVLDNDSLKIDNSSSAADIDEWDSLNHVQLVVNIEKHFKVRFNSTEIQNWTNVGEMVASIASKING